MLGTWLMTMRRSGPWREKGGLLALAGLRVSDRVLQPRFSVGCKRREILAVIPVTYDL
jgi:hypothetical protein